MIAIILVASVETELERTIASRSDMSELKGLPKALLPLGTQCILDHWWDTIRARRDVESVFLVTCGARYKGSFDAALLLSV